MTPIGVGLGGARLGLGLAQGAGAAKLPWYRAGGAPAPVAAWQPKGAASLAASYVNLANPGTYNAAPGVAPSFDAATGWTFDGSTQYLTTGVVLSSAATVILRFAAMTNTGRLAGSYEDGKGFMLIPRSSYDSKLGFFHGSSWGEKAPTLTSGNICLAGPNGYRNGVLDVPNFSVWSGSCSLAMYIGAINSGVPSSFAAYSLQALAIYSSTLTGPQVAAVSLAMSLL